MAPATQRRRTRKRGSGHGKRRHGNSSSGSSSHSNGTTTSYSSSHNNHNDDDTRPMTSKAIPHTNITAQALDTSVYPSGSALRLLHELVPPPSDPIEVVWARNHRPLQNITHPSVAFQQGIKTLRPAIMFNTYDRDAARSRRALNQKVQARKTAMYRARRLTPTVALKAIGDRKKLNQIHGRDFDSTAAAAASAGSSSSARSRHKKQLLAPAPAGDAEVFGSDPVLNRMGGGLAKVQRSVKEGSRSTSKSGVMSKSTAAAMKELDGARRRRRNAQRRGRGGSGSNSSGSSGTKGPKSTGHGL